MKLHLDYDDILYNKPNNENFENKMESAQYKACLTITDGIQRTSREQLFDELGLHRLIIRRCCNNVGSLRVLGCSLVMLMNTNLAMVLVIQSILCVHGKLKLKRLNIYSCTNISGVSKIRTF